VRVPANGYYLAVSFRKILAFVFGMHGAIALALCLHHFFANPPKKKKIVVHTFKRPDPPKTVIAKAPSPPPKKKSGTKPQKKPPKKEPPSPKKKELIPKKETPPSKEETLVSLPKQSKVETLPSPLKEDPQMLEYGGVLISFFQESLDLPDFGEVMMKIEIDGKGKIVSSEVMKTESSANEEFLKNRLPELVCPCFNSDLNTRNSFEFTIVFKNR